MRAQIHVLRIVGFFGIKLVLAFEHKNADTTVFGAKEYFALNAAQAAVTNDEAFGFCSLTHVHTIAAEN